MPRHRGVDDRDLATVRAQLRSPSGRRALYDRISEAWEGRQGFIGDRRVGGIELVSAYAPPTRVVPMFSIRVTYYRTAKGTGDRGAVYEHKHNAPYPLLARDAKPFERATRTSRDAARPSGEAVFLVGRLVGFEGEFEDEGISFPARSGVRLAADPRTRRMLVIGAPFYVLSNGSQYRVEDRGIVG